MDSRYLQRQFELLEFCTNVYHSGLRSTSVNGALYEDALIKYLREDVPELGFYKGQIIDGEIVKSKQIDIIVTKKGITQPDFLKGFSDVVNLVGRNDALAAIELKKWCQPKMIEPDGVIPRDCKKFKRDFPELKYFFVAFRNRDRLNSTDRNWHSIIDDLETDGNYCFAGNTRKKDHDWETPWNDKVRLLHKEYWGQYEALITTLKSMK